MAWTDPETKSTGNLITAAYWNQMLGPSGNQVLTAPGLVTTAGDIVYATGNNATTRLASSGGGSKFLQMNSGATAPAWVTALTSVAADTTPQLGGFLDANGHYIQMEKGGDIASASPTVVDTDGDFFVVTGTTGFSVLTVAADRHFFLEFAAALTMTHGSGTLDLPGAANITTAAGDVAEFFSTASNVVTCVNYTKADGTAVVSSGGNVSDDTTETITAAWTFNAGPIMAEAEDGTPTANTLYKESVVKAWVNWNGTGTIAIRDSYNVSSITDNGTGDFTITWDLDFADVNYSAVVCGSADENRLRGSADHIVGSMKVLTRDSSGTATDEALNCVMAIGNQ